MRDKIEWTKCPSVMREGKWFYTAFVKGKRYWITQGLGTLLWHLSNEDGHLIAFSTLGEAKREIENLG